MVYNDKVLKDKLKEWGYDEDPQSFTYTLSGIKRFNKLRVIQY